MKYANHIFVTNQSTNNYIKFNNSLPSNILAFYVDNILYLIKLTAKNMKNCTDWRVSGLLLGGLSESF